MPLALSAIAYAAGSSIVGAAASAGPDNTWVTLLIVAGVIGLPLSIPVLCWFLFALGAPLIQGAVILAAMVLLGAEVWYGRVDPLWAALPLAFTAPFAVQLPGGRPWLARLRRQQAQAAPLAGRQNAVVLDCYWHGARNLIETCAISEIYCPAPRKKTKGAKRYFWLVTGLRRWTAKGAQGRVRFLKGKPELVKPLPLVMFFHFTSISGSAHSRWVAGFLRSSHEPFDGAEGDGYAALFTVRSMSGDEGSSEAVAEVMARAREIAEARRTRDEALRSGLDTFFARLPDIGETSPRDLEIISLLEREPQHLESATVPHALNWIKVLMARRDAWTIHDAARLLAAFPHASLKPHADALAELFNSRKLALHRDLGHGFDTIACPRTRRSTTGASRVSGCCRRTPAFITSCPASIRGWPVTPPSFAR